MVVYNRRENSYRFDQYDYNLIDWIYNDIKEGSRVIFLIRHAERVRDYSHNWWLTIKWIEQAKELWKRLIWWNFNNTNSDFYWSTSYKRTFQTSYHVWCSRWYVPFFEWEKPSHNNREKYDKIYHNIEVVEFNRFKNINNTDIPDAADDLVNEVCILTEWHPFSFISTHDYLLIPLIRWVTENNIQFSYEKWINYLSWIAIIVNETWEWEVYPVRTLNEKSMVRYYKK